MFRLGYNTNGLAHHRLGDALRLLADLGYEAVALTPDVGHLDPRACEPGEVEALRRLAEALGLALAVETGARFVLDPRRKHFPTLLEEAGGDRARRVGFLRWSVDLAADLGARVVSMWSGAAPGGARGDPGTGDPAAEALWRRLCDGVGQVLEHCELRGVRLAFEPEPGMFLERPAGYLELRERLGAGGERLGLCLDVGHLLCTGDLPVGRVIAELAPHLLHVHLDDVKDGVHEHLPFGQGDLDLPETLAALRVAGFDGIAAVELSRDSHRGAQAALEAMGALRAALAHHP